MQIPASTWFHRSVPMLSGLVILCGLLAWEITRILALNNGLFVYTMDDPYIHLALAENLQQGWYGINAGEFSAPSSSILWPMMLVPGAQWDLTPLWLNLGAAIAAVILLAQIVAHSPTLSSTQQSLLVSALVPALNLVGLVLMGMEHTLQLACVLSIAQGVLILHREQRLPWWLPVSIVFSVAVRYENLAIALPTVILLWAWNRRRTAMATGFGVLLVVGAFSAFLVWHGHDPLPSSVAAKSALVGASSVQQVLHHLGESLTHRQGVVVWMILLSHIVFALTPATLPRTRTLHAAVAAALAFHVLGGRYGIMDRYEVYILAFGLLTLVEPIGRGIASLSLGRRRWARVAGTALMGLALTVFGAPYIKGLAELPHAAQNVYLQQYQMHRFATEYWRRPIAVNDLGFVSYGNAEYVLDLWGLGSEQALQLRRSSTDKQWIASLAARHRVQVAMIYDQWLGPLPHPWVRVAWLRFTAPIVSAVSNEVAIYARQDPTTDSDLIADVQARLKAFSATLPAEATLTIME